VSNTDIKAEVARGDHEDVPPLSSSGQIGHFIKWKRAKRHTALLHEAGCLLLGLVSLATVTGLYFWLDAPLVAAAFTYLVVLVMLSLVSSYSSLIVLSLIGVCCLSYFFAPPIYSFRVDYSQDLITIAAFVITSFVVNFLVTRVRAEQRERKRAEQALRESEYKLRQIIETVPSLLWSVGPDGEPTHVSQRVLDYSGMRLEDFKRGGWEAFVHPADFPETERALEHAIQTGTSYEAVHRLRRVADGEHRWHHARGEPLRDRDGRIVQWYGLSIDIDERKKAEDLLSRSEAYLANSQRLSHTGTAVFNATTVQHVYWSDENYRIWALDPLQGLPSHETVRQRIHPDDRDGVWQTVQEALRQKKDYSGEFRIVLPNGTVKYLTTNGHHLFSTDGELVEVIATSVDVTDHKRAEERLRVQHTVAQILAEAATIEEATPRILVAMGECLGWDVGVLWRVDREAEALRCVELWHKASIEVPEFERVSRESTFGPGVGLPGRVWSSLEPEYIPDVVPDENFPRAPIAEREGLRAAFGFPVLLGGEVLGVIEFFSREIRQPDQVLLNVLATIGSQIGQFIERKRAEEALRESEYKLRQIIETVPGLVWSLAPDGEPTHFNRRFLDYFGNPFEDFKHGGWLALIHPDDVLETERTFSHAIQTGTSYRGVLRFRRADGEYRWHEGRGEPLRDRQGNIIQWYGLSVDIDEAKKAEDRLRRSEAYLAEAQRLGHTGVAAYNETMVLYGSEEIYRIWGFDPAQGVPSLEAVLQRVHPDDRDRHRAQVKRALDERRRYSIAYRVVMPDGTVKHLESIGQPVFSASGELVEVVSTQIDVTERKRAEEALRESEARARSALEGIDGLIVVLAPNGELETANRQCLEYFGRSLEWLADWGTNDAVHPEDLPRFVEIFGRAMASGLRYHAEIRLRCIDGGYRWFDTRGVPIRDDTGRVVRWYVLLTDIEDRARALARLEQMQSDLAHMNRVSMMGELAASLSHEITQPIASARNNARAAQNFLDMQPPDLGEVREALSCVVGDTDRAGDIVDRIRDQLKKTPPRKEHFDLNEAVNEVIALGRSEIVKNGVSIQTRLSEGLSPIHCDRVQLQQVVLNLILNAAEAMGSVEAAPRDLLISTEQNHAGVLVAVRDSGPGIDPMHLERVFEAFYTTKSRGVGMGLSICRSIIDAHGGRLWAEANEPRGTIFQFTLPSAGESS
jgi:PAS domain S-box-containing protein